jgi:rhodanese-related sulfurtransferase
MRLRIDHDAVRKSGVPDMSISEVSATEAMELLANGAVLIDVRQENEWDLGHAPMATPIPLAELPDYLGELPHDQVVVCVCRSGARSLRAAAFLEENGFDVRNLTGGMIAWSGEGLPFVSENGEPSID